MKCKICGSVNTCKAHLIPKTFVNEVKTDNRERHLFTDVNLDSVRTNFVGDIDDSILCRECDNSLSKNENTAKKFLAEVRSITTDISQYGEPCIVEFPNFLFKDIAQFAAGVVWKYSQTKIIGSKLSLGKYAETLSNIVFQRAKIPDSVDLIIFRMVDGTDETFFYRTPYPSKIDHINTIRFSVGGCIFVLKLDQRNLPLSELTSAWLSSSKFAKVSAASAPYFPEWKKHQEIVTNKRVWDKISKF